MKKNTFQVIILFWFMSAIAYASYFPQTQIIGTNTTPVSTDADQHGNTRLMTDATLEDTWGHYAHIDFMHELKVVEAHRLVGTGFMGSTVDSNFWTAVATGTNATYSQSDLDFNMASGNASGSYAQLQSVRHGRFVFANPMIFRTALKISALEVASNTRRFGAFSTASGTTDPVNGFFFSLNASGVLSVNSVASGSITSVAAGSFNGSVASITMDTNVADYEIHYFLMKVEFYRKNVLLHTMTPTTGMMANSLNVPITIQSVNGSGAIQSGVIDVYAATIIKLGKEETQPASKFFSATTTGTMCKYGAGILHLLTFGINANNSNVTLYDGIPTATGTVLFQTGTMGANTVPFTLDLHEVPFSNGLYIVIASAASNLTIVYE